MLILQADPANEALHAALFSACTKNMSYDRQSESSRARWLLDMIEVAGRADDFFESLVATLRSCDYENEHYDVLQIYELLCLLAAKDRRRDRRALQEFLFSLTNATDWLWHSCAARFIELSGFDGLMTSVSLFETNLIDDFENWGGWAFHHWVKTLEERDGVEETADALADARPRNAALDELMRRDAARLEAEERPKAATSPLDYETLKAAGKGFPFQWIRHAPDAEIAQAAADLFEARETRVICNYLMIFGRRDFPFAPERLFGFLNGDEERPTYFAARALGRLKHSSIRAYGLDLLDQGKSVLGLKLLRSNIVAGDFVKIDMLLAEAPDDDDLWHEIGHGLLNIAATGQIGVGEYTASLVRLYEKGPCAICRRDLVRILRDAGRAPDWMAQECAFDCDEDTRSVFCASV